MVFPAATTELVLVDKYVVLVQQAESIKTKGAWVKSKHDVYLIGGSVGAFKLIFTHPPEG